MTLTFVRPGAWVGTVSGLGALVWASLVPIGSALPPPSTVVPILPARVAAYPADSLVGVAIARDVFRAGRRPAAIAYEPARALASPEGPVPRPVLALVGMIGGPTPTAVIEGVPGFDGARVLLTGDIVAGLRVRTIGADSVVISGRDTVWVLRMREPWKQ